MALQHFENYSLKQLNSFGLETSAAHFWQLDQHSQLSELMEELDRDQADYPNHPEALTPLLVGEGSNLLLTQHVARPVVKFGFQRVELLHEKGDEVIVQAQAGASWHPFVQHCLAQGWFGLENLSLIPGTVGASPVQNIGAYGVELKDSLESLEAWNAKTRQFVQLGSKECQFSYRDSLFKSQPELWITSVRFRLSTVPNLRLNYGELQAWLHSNGCIDPTPTDVARAVIAIRSRKLPDPKVLGNAGSFFKNPIVDLALADQLLKTFPHLPSYPDPIQNLRKISAAWLIDQVGFRGVRQGDAGVHQAHALVLVNYGKATGEQLLALANQIQQAVLARFDIALEVEPTII